MKQRNLAQFLEPLPRAGVRPNATGGSTPSAFAPIPARDEFCHQPRVQCCCNAVSFVAIGRRRLVVAKIPFPFRTADQISERVGQVTRRTRLALLDHVTSQTG